ncbi:hypothetical protein VC0101557_13620 [Vibrio cholerae VC0101557]|uniref:Uncharacterized protein n=2 Tax=Vibrio cholerae TaxID=666 RepID=A0A655RT03_VIBCL|nr:hypothetical protein ASZ86_03401 [Vibrio cholerae]EAZ76417.1 hypothetical protein A5E_1742 [Vibrio cholerae B33]EET23862.1 conserved hypothetical protein [Vibrio cholerae MO10]EET91792.1 hypothetical protein VCH_003033 [Vibrio cholerae CIRS101]EEY47992.1 hypothetical protein VIG_002006 [Vibrio cholerae INDRE 91/1]EGR01281.1 hypothetical protein VCHCUF01_2408 [Vibrio cholerae HCUF01]EGR05306.1 hypothetical protein VCHC49A2_0514 [Vibrio cholerae HC-49A2]EGS49319.1 hypothetical protein VCHC4
MVTLCGLAWRQVDIKQSEAKSNPMRIVALFEGVVINFSLVAIWIDVGKKL